MVDKAWGVALDRKQSAHAQFHPLWKQPQKRLPVSKVEVHLETFIPGKHLFIAYYTTDLRLALGSITLPDLSLL